MVQDEVAGRKDFLPDGVTLAGVIFSQQGSSERDGTGYGLHSGESHKGVSAEGVKHLC